jgi:ABC-type transport system involved in cytochrome bd biosynthesis fused ATPase/permease subunit
MSLLGEMTKLEEKLVLTKNPHKVDGNGFMHCLSYAAQSPWLQHLSIKDNIIFGSPLDEGRYGQVVDACALRADLDMLEDGDATEIGARGVSLSGGQKARYGASRSVCNVGSLTHKLSVALARAVYARTKYALLNNPLSAVVSTPLNYLSKGIS